MTTKESLTSANTAEPVGRTGEVSEQTSFKLSDMATFWLSFVSDKNQRGETVMVSDIPDEGNDALGELLQYKLVELVPGTENLRVTKTGQNAIGKGIALVYPLMPQGTASSYNKTILSMSSGAKNALLKALTATWPTVGRDIESRALGSFLEMLVRCGALHKVRPSVNKQLHSQLQDSMEYYISKAPSESERVRQYAELASHWKDRAVGELRSTIEEEGELILSKPLNLGSSSIEKIQKAADGVLTFYVKDNFTGEVTELSEGMVDLTVDQISRLVSEG